MDLLNFICIFIKNLKNMEIWRDIKGYENLYQISSEGRVRSLDRYVKNKGKLNFRKGKILTTSNRNGYSSVSLSKDGVITTHSVHRLVALAFLDNPNDFSIINHRNEIKNDNRVENLEWCTHKYNMNYGTINKRRGESLGYGKNNLCSKPILQFTKNGELVRKWDCSMDIERELGFDNSNITKCCNGKKHYLSAYGYKWGYEKDYERIPFKVFDIEIYRKRVA